MNNRREDQYELFLSKNAYYTSSLYTHNVDITELTTRVGSILESPTEINTLMSNEIYRENVLSSVNYIFLHSILSKDPDPKHKKVNTQNSPFSENAKSKLSDLLAFSNAQSVYNS